MSRENVLLDRGQAAVHKLVRVGILPCQRSSPIACSAVHPSLRYTKGEINRAGDVIRRAQSDEGVDRDAYEQAVLVVAEYRASHSQPLVKATMGLRSVVTTVRKRNNVSAAELRVSQRLKRLVTIFDKLQRQPDMRLARMQDIAGCRCVVRNIEELEWVRERLSRNRPPTRVADYISNPKPSGYRGVHLVVQYDQCDVEVQLRTPAQGEWAVAVERLGGLMQVDLKSGDGPAEVLRYLNLVAEAIALEEAGAEPPRSLLDEMGNLRARAFALMTADRGGR